MSGIGYCTTSRSTWRYCAAWDASQIEAAISLAALEGSSTATFRDDLTLPTTAENLVNEVEQTVGSIQLPAWASASQSRYWREIVELLVFAQKFATQLSTKEIIGFEAG